MSAQGKLNQIRRLDNAVRELVSLQLDIYDLDVDKYEKVGNGQWHGRQNDLFIEKLDDAKRSKQKAIDDFQSTINGYNQKKRNLAYEIDPVKYPTISDEARRLAGIWVW
ncbi:MAG: hypothetical protein LBM27_04505 [Lactobacillaceae bacterium]|jgi:hypothetical protein|nr:hypothetical protein [Lactobacillaceae bacterium]